MDKLTLGIVAAVAAVVAVAFYDARKDAPASPPATSVDPNMVVRSPFKGDDGMFRRATNDDRPPATKSNG